MKKSVQNQNLIILFVLLLFTALPGAAAGKNSGEQRSNRPVTKIDLGIRELTMEAGDTYTFTVTYEPENTARPYLRWYSSNESVIQIDGIRFTVTALSPGNAVIYAESLDSASHAVCSVEVSGAFSKDAADLIPGRELVPLTETERVKITSGPLKSFLDYVLSTDFSAAAYQKAAQRDFMVAADVVPGTEKAESQKALSLGMTASYPLENLNMITLQGTFEQIMAFSAENPDLLEIFGGEYYFLDTLETETASEGDPSDDTQKLKGHTETITDVSIAHNLGYTGEGTTIAVLDTGLNSAHEQFAGRVIREKCFTSTREGEKQDTMTLNTKAVCTGGNPESDSALPDFSFIDTASDQALSEAFDYFHGSHVAGIAAGRDGIAPKANIVAVQIFSWGEYICGTAEEGAEPVTCYQSVETSQDKYRAYNYILGLINEGIRIDVVNMSYGDSTENGGKGFSSVCDTVRPKDASLFKKMAEAGIIPVASSGNDSNNDKVNYPACVSDVFSVGACTKYDDSPDTPVYISAFSDHSRDLVDILAPGNKIRSALLFDPAIYNSEARLVLSSSSYAEEDGTSMSAPMVSGAFALLKQAVPGRTVDEYKQLLLDISRSEANIRRGPNCDDPNKCTYEYTFPYTKKVLNFDGFQEFLNNIPGSVPPKPQPPVFYRLDILPKTGFSALKPQKLSAQPLSVEYKPTHLTIQIPTLDTASDIVTVPFTDGEYPVDWLGNSVGMLEGSSLPGEGLTVLTGHNHLNTTEAGPFAFLSSLDPGDSLIITDDRGVMQIWHVYQNTKIPVDGFSAIAGDVKDNTLVLLTCEDESPECSYLNRRIILAEL